MGCINARGEERTGQHLVPVREGSRVTFGRSYEALYVGDSEAPGLSTTHRHRNKAPETRVRAHSRQLYIKKPSSREWSLLDTPQFSSTLREKSGWSRHCSGRTVWPVIANCDRQLSAPQIL